MLPLFTFASGIMAGVVGVHLLKKAKAPAAIKSMAGKARSGLDRAGEELREATLSGLNVVDKSSATLRARLTGEVTAAADEPAPDTDAAEPSSTSSSTRKNERA